ncbi:MAG: hypothetical protein IT566_05640 [Rhodospirillaceae bacterium]|nr:hypothetical protein [Rhodospirillaceae bacterium]
MSSRIARLRVELERLEGTTDACHPDIQDELQTLIDDMKAHLTELEDAETTADAD